MPFATDEFLALFAAYNRAIWPLQPLALLAGLVAVGLLARPSRMAGAAIALLLAELWALDGIAYHGIWLATLTPAAWLFAALFVLEAAALAAVALAAPGLRFAIGGDLRSAVGLGLVAYALVGYPLVGRLAGHAWPALPMFGVAPCPTDIFTIGLLALGRGGPMRGLLAIPVLWAGVGGTAAVLLAVPQDYGLIAAGLAGVALLLAGRPPRPAMSVAAPA